MSKLKILGLLASALVVGVAQKASADATYDGAAFYTKMVVTGGQSGGQRIDTGYFPKGGTIVRARLALRSATYAQTLFCSRYSSSSQSTSQPGFTLFANVNASGGQQFVYCDYKATTAFKPTVGEFYDVEVKDGKFTLSQGDEVKASLERTGGAASFESGAKLYLFSSYTSTAYLGWGNGADFLFEYLRIYEVEDGDEVLKHEFVPCKTAAGTVAVADTVTETVIYNGSGNAAQFSVDEADRIKGAAIVEKTVYAGGLPPEATETTDKSPVVDKEYSFAANEYKLSDRQLYKCGGYTVATSADGVEWTEGELVKATSYSFTYKSDYVRVTWHYELAGYEIAVSANIGGVGISRSIEPLFESAYALDAEIAFTAPEAGAQEGVRFVRWRGDTADGSDVLTTTVTVKADRARTLTAKYAQDWSYDGTYMTDGEWKMRLVLDKADSGYLTGIADLTPEDSAKDLDLSKPIRNENGGLLHIHSLNGLLSGLKATGRLILPDDGYLTDLGNNAFLGSKFTGTVVIPASVQTAGPQMFMYCPVETVEFKTSAFANLPDNSFMGCSKLKELTFPQGFAFTNIGNSAFENCSVLTAVDPQVLFSKVESIGANAFKKFQSEVGIGAIASVALPAVRTVGESAFSEAVKIEEISFGRRLTALGSDSAGAVAQGVFYKRWGGMELRKVAFAADPSSALTPYLFYNCLKLSDVRWGKAVPPATMPSDVFGNENGTAQFVTNYVRAAKGWTDVDWRSDKAPYRLGSDPESRFGTWVWGNGKGAAQGLEEGAYVYLAAEPVPGLSVMLR